MMARPFEVVLSTALITYCTSAYAVQYATVSDVQRTYFPSASTFIYSEKVLSVEEKEILEESLSTDIKEDRIAYSKVQSKSGQTLGYIFIDEVIGKHELITYAVAFSATKKILGVEVLEYRETRGQEIIDPNWRKQFEGLGSGALLKVGKDIQNISGATLSCVHVTEGVKRITKILEHIHDI